MLKQLNIGRLSVIGLVFVTMAACTTVNKEQPAAAPKPVETLLLVSREDGSIVRQSVALDAEICMKLVTSSKTTCLTEGPAVVNSAGIVVGYEMHQKVIDLERSN